MFEKASLTRSNDIKKAINGSSPSQPRRVPGTSSPKHIPSSSSLHNPVVETPRLINAFGDDVEDGDEEDEDESDSYPSTRARQLGEFSTLPSSLPSSHNQNRPIFSTMPTTRYSNSPQRPSEDTIEISRNHVLDRDLNFPDCSRRFGGVESESSLQRNMSCRAEIVQPSIVHDEPSPRPRFRRTVTTPHQPPRSHSKRPHKSEAHSAARRARAGDFQVVGIEYYASDPSSSTGVCLLPDRPQRRPRMARSPIRNTEIGGQRSQYDYRR